MPPSGLDRVRGSRAPDRLQRAVRALWRHVRELGVPALLHGRLLAIRARTHGLPLRERADARDGALVLGHFRLVLRLRCLRPQPQTHSVQDCRLPAEIWQGLICEFGYFFFFFCNFWRLFWSLATSTSLIYINAAYNSSGHPPSRHQHGQQRCPTGCAQRSCGARLPRA